MKGNEQSSDIQKILSLSEKMLEKARQEDWEDVTSMETQRRDLIASVFSSPVRVGNGKLADGIRLILEKDREIVKLGAAHRDAVRGALRRINRGKNAVEAYAV